MTRTRDCRTAAGAGPAAGGALVARQARLTRVQGREGVQASSRSAEEMGLTRQQKLDFIRDGFVKLPQAVPPELVQAARRAINTTLGQEGIDKEKIVIFQSQSWTPNLRNSPAITDLFNKSSLAPTLREALGGDPDVFPPAAGGQIALRFPLDQDQVEEQLKRPAALRWGGHLDGLHTPTNGVPKGVLGTFTCLVGVALSRQTEEFAGNLGVVKGGNQINERFFRMQQVRPPKLTVGCSQPSLHTNDLPCYAPGDRQRELRPRRNWVAADRRRGAH